MSLHDRAQNATPIVTHPAPRTRIETAVILAAGKGSRLRLNGDPTPKPLQELLGLTLVERAIRCSREAGVSRFLVVVGYEADAVADALHRVARELAVEIETVLNPRWREGNGTSALAAEPYLAADEPFFLMMCDHIFPRTFLERLAEQDLGVSCLVVIDRDVGGE
jgi:choline kinase